MIWPVLGPRLHLLKISWFLLLIIIVNGVIQKKSFFCVNPQSNTISIMYVLFHIFSQFIHHILLNISANQSLYQESFSFNVT